MEQSGDRAGEQYEFLISLLIVNHCFCRSTVITGCLCHQDICQQYYKNPQSAPPNQVLIAISLFLTFFIMQPVFGKVYTEAIIPYDAGEIGFEEACSIAAAPMRQFMFEQTQRGDINAFMQIANVAWDGETEAQVPTSVLIPSFIVSELRTAFIIGFMIYIPFIVIDMVVASVLMSMGMMMLPPTTISMPFKILLFVLADGWNLVIVYLVQTFY